MTQIDPSQTTFSPPPSPADLPAEGDPSVGTDRLLHLHKMSTTAGLGSADYVAINVLAIVSVLFGLASWLAGFSNVLLVIPAVGLLLGIVALRQVGQSNGTQTGRGMAWLGVALSVIIALIVLGLQIAHSVQQRADAEGITQLCRQFGALVAQEKYPQAYQLLDSEFQSRVPENLFAIHLHSLQHSSVTPPMKGMEWNGEAEYQRESSDNETAETMVRVEYQNISGEERLSARLRKVDGTWKFDNLPELFPPPRQAPAARR